MPDAFPCLITADRYSLPFELYCAPLYFMYIFPPGPPVTVFVLSVELALKLFVLVVFFIVSFDAILSSVCPEGIPA